MISLSLQEIIDSNFKKIEQIKNVTIISDLGTFNYLLLKNNKKKDFFDQKTFVIYDKKLYQKQKVKFEQSVFPNAKVTNIINHSKDFNIQYNDKNIVIFIYDDLKNALKEHNLNTNYQININ